MDIRLLGPVEAWRDGAQLDLGPRRQRFFLAVLALELNRLVDLDRLIDLAWPDTPPRTSRHAVHVAMSRLRSVLLEDSSVRLVHRGTGYALQADALCSDVQRFRALVEQSKRDGAHRTVQLREALSLWRGAALADLRPPESVNLLTRGLTEERLAAEEELMGDELAAGHHLAVLGRLHELVCQFPFRQRFVELLMLAQYRAGLIMDALATYRFARDAMVHATGLDPWPPLRRLEEAILRSDPRLEIGIDIARPFYESAVSPH